MQMPPRSRYSLYRTYARPPSRDGDDGTGFQGFCAGEKVRDPAATRARRLFIPRRGEVAPMVALQGTVIPSTTVLSAVCRGGTRLWGEPLRGLQAHIDKSAWVCYSFFVYIYRERERGLGGSTEG